MLYSLINCYVHSPRNLSTVCTCSVTPVFFPGESHRQRSLAGDGPQSLKESDMTEVTEHVHTVLRFLGLCT